MHVHHRDLKCFIAQDSHVACIVKLLEGLEQAGNHLPASAVGEG